MASATATDVQAMQAEIEELRAAVARAADRMRDLSGEESGNGHDKSSLSPDRVWTEMKRQAQQVTHEIEERPLVSAVTAFSAGIALGILLGGRH